MFTHRVALIQSEQDGATLVVDHRSFRAGRGENPRARRQPLPVDSGSHRIRAADENVTLNVDQFRDRARRGRLLREHGNGAKTGGKRQSRGHSS